METQQQQTEAEKSINPGLLQTIRKWSMMVEMVYNTAKMRYYQKAFFRERENEKLKREYLAKAKEYEKTVDDLLEHIWPSSSSANQQKLF
jgi:hypothetical protein